MADVLVTHPQLTFGGSEATVLWTVQALRDEHEVTVCTTDMAELRELNDFAGTDLSPDDFSLSRAPLPFPLSATDRFDALKGRLFARYCQKVADDHDLTISGYNVLEVDTPSIQMIADFSFAEGIRDQVTSDRSGIEQAWSGKTPLRSAYLAVLDALFPQEGDETWAKDRVLANSEWTRSILEEELGVDSDVVYPPVPPSNPPEDMGRRPLGFVALGRVVREKRTHVAIEILDRVRERGHDAKLTIVGPAGEADYGRRIRSMVGERGAWIDWLGRVSETKKEQVLAENPYAISGRRREPFGIAVAEVVQAGCIPFLPDEGGQTEIVDDERLTYGTVDEAVEAISRVLVDEKLQGEIREQLFSRRDRFTAERFQQEITEIVQRTLKEAEHP